MSERKAEYITGAEEVSPEDEIAEFVLELLVSWGAGVFDPDGLERSGSEISATTYDGRAYRITVEH